MKSSHIGFCLMIGWAAGLFSGCWGNSEGIVDFDHPVAKQVGNQVEALMTDQELLELFQPLQGMFETLTNPKIRKNEIGEFYAVFADGRTANGKRFTTKIQLFRAGEYFYHEE